MTSQMAVDTWYINETTSSSQYYYRYDEKYDILKQGQLQIANRGLVRKKKGGGYFTLNKKYSNIIY